MVNHERSPVVAAHQAIRVGYELQRSNLTGVDLRLVDQIDVLVPNSEKLVLSGCGDHGGAV